MLSMLKKEVPIQNNAHRPHIKHTIYEKPCSRQLGIRTEVGYIDMVSKVHQGLTKGIQKFTHDYLK